MYWLFPFQSFLAIERRLYDILGIIEVLGIVQRIKKETVIVDSHLLSSLSTESHSPSYATDSSKEQRKVYECQLKYGCHAKVAQLIASQHVMTLADYLHTSVRGNDVFLFMPFDFFFFPSAIEESWCTLYRYCQQVKSQVFIILLSFILDFLPLSLL